MAHNPDLHAEAVERSRGHREHRNRLMQTRTALWNYVLAIGLTVGATASALAAPTIDNEPAETSSPVLWVEVVSGPTELNAEAIRIAIGRELGVSTSSQSARSSLGHLRIDAAARSGVSVRYESADGSTKLERRVNLPVAPERRALVIAWVAGNLVRNEAAELLSGFSQQSRSAEHAAHGETSDAKEATTAQAAAASVATSESKPRPAALEARAVTPARVKFEVTDGRANGANLGSTRIAHLALISPFVATDRHAAAHAFYLSFGAGYSDVGAVDGFGLGLLVDRIEYRVRGAQTSALWIDEGSHDGVAIAGLGTSSRGDLRGVEMSGLVNVRSGSAQGAQLAGVANMALDGGSGAQLSGLFNYQGADFDGAQISGGLNLARRVSGLQLGMLNLARGDRASAAQISGTLNVAEDMAGVQVGLVNVARDVNGVQLGLVNVSRQTHGVSLGLFNWSEGVRVQPIYFFQNPGYHNVGYRSLSGCSTGSISFGYDPSRERARTHFAVGVRKELDRVGLGIETGYGWVLEHLSTGATDRAHELDLVGTVSVEIVRNAVTLFGGGGIALPVAGVVAIEPRGLAHVGIGFL